MKLMLQQDFSSSNDEKHPTVAEVLHVLNILRCGVALQNMREGMCAQFYNFQKSLLAEKATKKIKKYIRDFSCRK